MRFADEIIVLSEGVQKYILFLGRIVPEKGVTYLIEAFKQIKTDKKLVIAGGSSDTEAFMQELCERPEIVEQYKATAADFICKKYS